MLNGETSESLNVISGVPQGSILGPLLFLIYIDDITKLSLSDGTKLILYADDLLLYRPISSPQDHHLLHHVDIVQAYASAQYMTFNRSKCKYMLVSRKRVHTFPDPVIYLYGLPLESVSSFKYFGVLLTSDLSWCGHVKNACTKARQLIGLIYRRFYKYSSAQTLRQLYLALVRPHLEYAVSVWSPHLQKDIDMLEKTQKFATKVCTKLWDWSYHELLAKLHLPTLTQRRLHIDLCLMYKIIHGLMYFPPDIVTPSTTVTHNPRSLLLQEPFARTNAYKNSFLPRSISNWNSLPNYVVLSPSFSSFKHSLSLYTL